jgi:Ca2+-binding RTX toxin-like protein
MTMHTQDTNLHAAGTAITGVSLDTWWISQNVLVDSENGYGFRGTGDFCTLRNIGTLWSETNFGVRYEGTNGHVFNSFLGTIGGHGGISLSPGTRLENSGKIISTGTGVGAAGIEVVAGAEAPTRIENSGTVSGELALLALARISLHNTGDVFGHIDLGDAPDVIRNAGTILGDVSLGSGADIYDGRGGLVQGVIAGEGGADTIIGGDHGDIIDGGAGRDHLRGGGGDDTFAFTRSGKADRISGFVAGQDSIWLENAVFRKLGEEGALDPSAFYVGALAHDADDRVIYDARTGLLTHDRNGDAAGGVTKIAMLTPGLDLGAGDFEVV